MKETRDGLTILAYVLIGAGLAIYGLGVAAAALTGFLLTFPFSLLGLVVFGLPVIGVGLLLIKVIRDRLNDPEDRHYSRDIHQ